MHLLAIELNLGRHLFKLSVENSAAKRRIRAAMQYEVQIEELRKIRNPPTSPQAQGGRHKEDLNTSNNCGGSSNKDRSTSEDDMTKGTTGEQIQKMQDKADFISKLHHELQQDIQVFKLNRLRDSGTNSNMINTGNERWTPHTTAVPDGVIHAHNRGTKQQVGGTLVWK